MFSISDKVVCVNDSFADWCRATWPTLPKKGVIYVIRGFSACAFDPDPGVLLVGITTSETTKLGHEKGFWHTRFRKLTDIQAENALRNAEPALANSKMSHPADE